MSSNLSNGISMSQCSDVYIKYEKLLKIGQGTFGEVFHARDYKTGQDVALKKILTENEKDGFPITALREIKILQHIHHPNVVELIEICNSRESNGFYFYLVFEYCEYDLAALLLNKKVKFQNSEIKNISKQLLEGLHYLHFSHILHRDIKAANILITKNGILKVADFGLARACKQLKPNQGYTNRVVTLWYRPPELLLGDKNYTTAVDMWGVGCIMAELWTKAPILQGSNEAHQMKLIINLLGSIKPEDWPEAPILKNFKSMHSPPCIVAGGMPKQRLRYFIKDPMAFELIDRLLVYNPAKRFDCSQALEDDYFYADPKPMSIANTLAAHETAMFEFLAPNRRGNGTQNQTKRETVSGVVYDRVY